MATQVDRRVVIVDVAPGKGIRQVNRQMGQLNKTTLRMRDSISRLNTAFAAIGGAFTGRALFGIIDTFQEVEQRMTVFLGDSQRAAEMVDALSDAAQRTYSSFDGVATVATRLLIMGQNLNATYEDFLNVAEGLAASFVLSGATVQEAVNAARQLAQGLGSGTLQGEELRAVLEQNALVAQRIADHFGVGIGELREMAAEGELVSQKVFDALNAGAEEWIKAMENFTPSFRQAMAMVSTAFGKLLNEMNRQLQLTKIFGDFAKDLVANMDDLGRRAGMALGAALFGALILSLKRIGLFFTKGGVLGTLFAVLVGWWWDDLMRFFDNVKDHWIPKLILEFEKAKLKLGNFFTNLFGFGTAPEFERELAKLDQQLAELDRIHEARIKRQTTVPDDDSEMRKLQEWFKEFAGTGGGITPKPDKDAIKDWERLRDTLDPIGAAFREYAEGLALVKANAPAEEQERYNKALKETLLSATGLRETIDEVDPTAPLIRQIEMLEILMEKFPEYAEVAQEAILNTQEEIDSVLEGSIERQRTLMGEVSTFVADQAGRMADAFVQFATDSEFAVRDMVEAMLKDLARLVIFKTITEPLATGIAGQFGQGGAPIQEGLTNAPVKALGGPVSPNHAYTVGEVGRETFVPNVAGRIIPHGGGGTNVQVINNTGSEATTERTRQADGSELIRVIVGEVANDINRNGMVGQSIQQQFGTSIKGVVR